MDEVIWFWQRMVTPHMAGLARALAAQGVRVTFVAERIMSEERAAQGWESPSLGDATLRLISDSPTLKRSLPEIPTDAVHICEGIRAKGIIGSAKRELARLGARLWVIMETVDDSGWRSLPKRILYRQLFRRWGPKIEGVLAIGQATPEWVVARGVPWQRVFPFAYFLLPARTTHPPSFDPQARFRVLFVGSITERKRPDMVIDAVSDLADASVELAVVGSGPLENALRARGEAALGNRLLWLGRKSQQFVPDEMSLADCLVLPSRFDGWGAVASEALMVGTPVIVSDRCGCAEVVRASGFGGVFPAGDRRALTARLRTVVADGRQRPECRARLAAWARCLDAEAGAQYLRDIVRYRAGIRVRPTPPWENAWAVA